MARQGKAGEPVVVSRRELIREAGYSVAVVALLGTACGSSSSGNDGDTYGKCTDTCGYARDSECDDGGAGAQYSECDYGTDCADCGPRDGDLPPNYSNYSDYSNAYSNTYSDYSNAYSDYSNTYSDYYSNSYHAYYDYYSNYYNYFVNSW